MKPIEGIRELGPEQRKVALDAARATDHDMVGSREPFGGHNLAGERPEAPLHPVADDGTADLLGHGEADAHRLIGVFAVVDEEDEAGRRCAHAAVGGKEVGPLADRF
jgi:hypothetical protein